MYNCNYIRVSWTEETWNILKGKREANRLIGRYKYGLSGGILLK
jgi:hypothetical protein